MDDSNIARWQEHGHEHGYVRARLLLLTAEQGGRMGAIHSGYRSCWGFAPEVHQEMHDGPLLIEEQAVLEPGAEATVRLHPLFPDLWPVVTPGMRLNMFEGSRRVGEATVLEVIASKAHSVTKSGPDTRIDRHE